MNNVQKVIALIKQDRGLYQLAKKVKIKITSIRDCLECYHKQKATIEEILEAIKSLNGNISEENQPNKLTKNSYIQPNQALPIILDIIRSKQPVKSSTTIIKELLIRGYSINQNSLKSLLMEMKKKGWITNSKQKGDWIMTYADGNFHSDTLTNTAHSQLNRDSHILHTW